MISLARSEFFPPLERKNTVEISEMIMSQTAELRQCITLFINIDLAVQLLMSKTVVEATLIGLMPFISRSEEELLNDTHLLHDLQMCMKIVTLTLAVKGGQIRQFIHDDKGTVCIGTIGLRGSTTEDNAAAAVVAAQSIITQLQSVGVNARIGIASGKAFCGLVGSSVRHEYAVMGPSVNLSSRLMSAAAAGSILCDQRTRDADRRHKFLAMSAIVAKGYDDPVLTFTPIDDTPRKGNCSTTSCKGDSDRSPASPVRSASPSPDYGQSTDSSSPVPCHSRSSFEMVDSEPFDADAPHDVEVATAHAKCYDLALRSAYFYGLFGRGQTLTEVFAFLTYRPKSAIHDSLRGSTQLNTIRGTPHLNSSLTHYLTEPKTNLLFFCGPFGVGKSALLSAVYSEMPSGQHGRFRFKYHVHTDSYDTKSPFLVWRKIISYLLAVTDYDVIYLDSPSKRSASTSQQPKKGSNKTVIKNILGILTLMDAPLSTLGCLLFNGVLSDLPTPLSKSAAALSNAERADCTMRLLANMLQKITDLLGGALLLAM